MYRKTSRLNFGEDRLDFLLLLLLVKDGALRDCPSQSATDKSKGRSKGRGHETHRHLVSPRGSAVRDSTEPRDGLELARVDEQRVVNDVVPDVEELDAAEDDGAGSDASVVVQVVVVFCRERMLSVAGAHALKGSVAHPAHTP